MQSVIPFAGFYASCHSEALDRAQEQALSDDSGTRYEFDDAGESYTSDMLNAYAREYVAAWSVAAGIQCEFVKVDSPRYYNFETDRIFARITEETAARLFSHVDRAKLDSIAKRRHTSRDGFISFYSPAVDDWGDVMNWEPEQLHTLILASLPDDMPEECYLVDDCNGAVSNLVYEHGTDKFKRCVKVADYLRERAARKYRKNTKE